MQQKRSKSPRDISDTDPPAAIARHIERLTFAHFGVIQCCFPGSCTPLSLRSRRERAESDLGLGAKTTALNAGAQFNDMTAPSAFVSLRPMQQGALPQRAPLEDSHTTQRLSGTVLHAQGGVQTTMPPENLGAAPVQTVSAPLAVTSAVPTTAPPQQLAGSQQHVADTAG